MILPFNNQMVISKLYPYHPECINGIEPSTHTVTARLDPPREFDLDSIFTNISTRKSTFDKYTEHYPFLRLLNSSRKSKSTHTDRDDENTGEDSSYFMNCIVFTVRTTDNEKHRNVSVKVFVNGSFQYTGCQNTQHIMDILMLTWDILTDAGAASKTETVRFKCRVDMINCGFNLGMKIDRPSLDFYIQQFPNIETCYDTMVNIAINIKMMQSEPELTDIIILEYNSHSREYTHSLGHEPNPDFGKKVKHTFRVFYGGTVIQSGRNIRQIMEVNNRFRRIIDLIRPHIEFKPDTTLERQIKSLNKLRK